MTESFLVFLEEIYPDQTLMDLANTFYSDAPFPMLRQHQHLSVKYSFLKRYNALLQCNDLT